MKHGDDYDLSGGDTSSLARGKWIEASECGASGLHFPSSLARGKWIEATGDGMSDVSLFGLPSQEGSGLKLDSGDSVYLTDRSSLSRGKWIEAPFLMLFCNDFLSSLARGKWIEA